MATTSAGHRTELQRLREGLLARWLKLALLAGTAPVLLSLVLSITTGDWRFASISALGLTGFGLVAAARRAPQQWRACAITVILYGLGVWMLCQGGALGVMYLMGSAVATALLCGSRRAMGVLALCTLTLLGVGVAIDPPMPQIPGLQHLPALAWLNRSAHFVGLGAVLTLSCAYLLRRLDSALARQRQVSATLQAKEEMLSQVTASVPGMVFSLRYDDQGRPHYLFVSPGSQALFGISPEALLADGTLMRRCVVDEDHATMLAAVQRGRQTGSTQVDLRVQLADGTRKWVHISSCERRPGPEGVVHTGIMVDISDRKAAEAQVWQQAHFDALTGLPNRRLLRERLQQALDGHAQGQRPLALMLIDLDHFKEVNDALGHDRGDQLLVEAAQRVLASVRDRDIVARMGGDEFTVVLTDLEHPDQVDRVATRILSALAGSFPLGADHAWVSASIGVALYPQDADDIDGLLKHADQALYAAKDAGRNRSHRFTPALHEQAQLRLHLASDLRHALAKGQLQLVYQPIMDLASGCVHKAEVLLRWQHPERGAISPAQFIPIAESAGLIGEIGDWVFRSAAAQAVAWRASLDPRFQVSVNCSPAQLRTDGAQRLGWLDQLAALGLPGDAVAVEITEGLLLDTGPTVSRQLLALRDAGVPVLLDDFGTGYSSMAYLLKFDIDVIKIDRSFVSGTSGSEASRALCKAMIVMAHELGLRVVAEGVETAEQLDWLRSAGCDDAQGYHVARPMPATDFEAFHARHRPQPRPAPALTLAVA